MKNLFAVVLLWLCGASSSFSEEKMIEEEVVVEGAPTFVVVLPEKIEEETYLPVGGNENMQHIVQSEIEKSLIRKDITVIEIAGLDPQIEGGLSWQTLTVKKGALVIARAVNADYLVYGQATVVRAGTREAYGVTATRAQANITARLVRVSDGKILQVMDAEALEGNAAFGIAANDALKAAGKSIAKKVATACEAVVE
ncbi:hypothetical protein P3T73_01960 [Kiritimatiellota bacterium B12222]|nr:hypothetical protein P3T73_01960 [Kiritimatiellota bacterium B12222]